MDCSRAMSLHFRWAGILLLTLFATSLPAAPAHWRAADVEASAIPATSRWARPSKSRAFQLDPVTMRETLDGVPREFTPAAQVPVEMALPMPDGTFARFLVCESPIMEPELAAKFPEIKTYCGQGIDDPAATLRFDLTPAGFHAQILSPKGAVYIDPARRGDARLHLAYHKRDHPRDPAGLRCLTTAQPQGVFFQPAAGVVRSGGTLRTYRLAVATTGEYTQFHGGAVSNGLAAVVTAVNRVNGIYETELAVRLVLVANNNLLIYTSPSSDPFSNDNPSALLTQSQSTIDSVILSANYDVGHVFNTDGGGLSLLGVVCQNGAKAQSETGSLSPVGDPYYIDFVAHEIGHAFGANHTFNGVGLNCGGNVNPATAYEPGSGSTIMGYAGICATDDLQLHSDPFFHSASIDEIQTYTASKSCQSSTATGNTAPSVSAGADFTIPKGTPFTLTASGSDTNGDATTFCWEQRDAGNGRSVTLGDDGVSPLFRAFSPTSSPARTFPRWSELLNNTTVLGERLPTTSRTLHFRVTARDNRAGGGGVATDDMTVTVAGAAGPFVVTAPNTAAGWSGARTVTWNVAGTTASPINAAAVDILLSTNGGVTFPVLLATNTPNDGSESILLPDLFTTQARIMVRATGKIFFDISDMNFSISVPAPQIAFDSFALSAENCPPANGRVDPGEVVTVNVALRNLGTAPATNLVAALSASGGVIPLSGPQNYGTLAPMGAAVTLPFTLLAAGACGGSITGVFLLTDGVALLPSVTNVFAVGISSVATNSFASGVAIIIPDSGAATPYPSVITVAGLSNAVTKVTVTLSNLSHTFPDDLDVLLVGPGGQTVLLMSDVGGSSVLSGITLTLDDSAASAMPDSSAITTGTWRPTNFEVIDAFSSPAPASPYGSTLSVFNGLNPAGVWSLYADDDMASDSGSIAGWRLTIATQGSAGCCSNSVPPSLTVEDTSLIEGNSGRADALFPLHLSRPVPQTVTVSYAAANGSALAGADYVATNGAVQFSPGQTNKSLQVGVLGDLLFEGIETFSVTLTAPVNATLSRATATGTILDDDVRVSASTVSNAHVRLEFNSATGATYRVESSDFLPNTNAWSILPGAALLNGSGSVLQLLDTNALAQPQRFYRVRQLSP